MSSKCPRCHRDTYSKKWGSCTACGLGGPTPDEVTKKVTEALEVTKRVTAKAQDESHDFPAVTPRVTPTPIVTDGVTSVPAGAEVVTQTVTPGDNCPTCGQKVPMTNAQRQAAYRGRKA